MFGIEVASDESADEAGFADPSVPHQYELKRIIISVALHQILVIINTIILKNGKYSPYTKRNIRSFLW